MKLERKASDSYRIGVPEDGEIYNFKISDHVLDSLYGHIGLTELEKNIERLAIFKRLHSISQLGLVNWVFPCALHTRYTHSIGVMHIAGQMAEHINQNLRKEERINDCFSEPFFDDNDIQIIRLAGMLHDIGHYPMSHNIEQAYKYAEKKKEYEESEVLSNLRFYVNCPDYLVPFTSKTAGKMHKKSSDFYKKFSGSTGLHHECIGQEVILNNCDIFNEVKWGFVLIPSHDKKYWVLNPKFWNDSKRKELTDSEVDVIVKKLMMDIGHMVVGNYEHEDHTEAWNDKYSAMVQIIHSELDADNLDYLLRDATFSGTSYGIMDMSVLLNCLTVAQLVYQKDGDYKSRYIVGIKQKGTGCVEQFLLNKFLAYTQMIFNKYTSILEAMLLRFEMGSVDRDDNNYNKNKIKDIARNKNTSLDYLMFSDYHIINMIFSANKLSYSMTPFPKASISRLKHSCAFDLRDDDYECVCTGISDQEIKKEIKKSGIYKRFQSICAKLKNKTGLDLQNDGGLLESNLYAFRFEEYALTKQVPLGIFMTQLDDIKSDSLWYDCHYYRLGDGIPILRGGERYKSEGITSTEKCETIFPPLCVDCVQSSLHKIYAMRYVSLREYKIEEYNVS